MFKLYRAKDDQEVEGNGGGTDYGKGNSGNEHLVCMVRLQRVVSRIRHYQTIILMKVQQIQATYKGETV